MSDDAPKQDAPASEAPKAEDTTKTFTQDQVNDLIAKEKGRFQTKYGDYDDLKVRAARLDELEAANATELEKAQGKATKAEQKAAEAESKLTRYVVAQEKKVPADAVDLLTGTTREDLEASADKILGLIKDSAKEPDFDGGAREPAPEPATPEAQHNSDILGLLGLTPQ